MSCNNFCRTRMERLVGESETRYLRSLQVKMLRPAQDYFNVMVLHQNRVDRGPKNYIPEDVLPNYLDLVIWGHEHDCIPREEITTSGIHIIQPGESDCHRSLI